jgi:hypothetical protein
MNCRNAILFSFVILAVAASGLHNTELALQWWSGYLSSFWGMIWGSISGLSISHHAAAVTVQQQFQNRLSALQNKTSDFSVLYVSDAQQYVGQFSTKNFSLNQSWSLQITDRNSTDSPVIGEMTITWIGPSRNLSIENGIVEHDVPTYSATGTHRAFMAISNDAVNIDVFSGIADYLAYNASKSVSARFVR